MLEPAGQIVENVLLTGSKGFAQSIVGLEAELELHVCRRQGALSRNRKEVFIHRSEKNHAFMRTLK